MKREKEYTHSYHMDNSTKNVCAFMCDMNWK